MANFDAFGRLPEIATAKPRSPEDDGLPLPAVEQIVQDAEQPEMSQVFKSLVDKLVHQHLLEVGLLEKRLAELQDDMCEMEGEVCKLRSENQTLKTPPTSKPAVTRSVTTALLCKQHQGLKEVHAEEILDAFDDSEEVEKLFETDFQRLLNSDTKYITDTSSVPPVQLTRFQCIRSFLQSNRYEMFMATILCVNVVCMALELQFVGTQSGCLLGMVEGDVPNSEHWTLFFLVVDGLFNIIYASDVLIRIFFLRRDFFRSWMSYLDMAVSTTALIEYSVYYTMTLPVNPVLFRLLRLGKLARAIRMVQMTSMLASLQLLVKCLSASISMLFWSFCLLTFIQIVAGLTISTLVRDFIDDTGANLQEREQVYLYFGTFTRTCLTMFEILFANWAPACRALVESVSEWFSLFFLLYRCILGFAILNVVNAVFVQQTMKTASSDEELAFKQKEKDIAMYTRKVKKLFQTMDQSGDGSLNLAEFAKLVKSPKLKFWMSQLELEYHDLLSLFEFLDNGDGEITLMEFIEGAARLKGHAKALDIWRMETKVEVLFEEVLAMLKADVNSPSTSASVQDVFNNSTYRHIKSVVRR
ncbi:unnamed protein product [Effrenium voratum]|nr:unnamed protein product [Effrenium voratum]